ncbi:hypothetical protein QTO34_014401 [Cnephaeus nilssonii]|uniref:Nuclear prelamin A recognition factor n=1 Tax=Cnephaeus nilssonii TaxID=3371016 RepID=A0AA40LU13_CNENI|nr:hypothetical protein QTO34_014401 [Eptesicus nilssonii]
MVPHPYPTPWPLTVAPTEGASAVDGAFGIQSSGVLQQSWGGCIFVCYIHINFVIFWKNNNNKKTTTDNQENATVTIRSPAQNGEKGEFHKLADAKIFLSDCLACDSCVTAEEGVQVSQQNTKDFFHVLNLNKKCDTSQHKVLVVSVCPQSLPYFIAKFSLNVTDASRGSAAFSKALGRTVFDLKIAADLASWRVRRNLGIGTTSTVRKSPSYPC